MGRPDAGPISAKLFDWNIILPNARPKPRLFLPPRHAGGFGSEQTLISSVEMFTAFQANR
tara:strand:+ start:1294 stop:1473 length:180 start_codon:yes stop_codon:yes gene_type:complete